MKVLMINGSPRTDGNTAAVLAEMEAVFATEGIETEIVCVGKKNIRGCIACKACRSTGKCVFDDAVNEIAAKFEECDGLVVASPVYYASPNATVIALMDRLFYSTHFSLIKSIALGKEKYGLPEKESPVHTSFVR